MFPIMRLLEVPILEDDTRIAITTDDVARSRSGASDAVFCGAIQDNYADRIWYGR